MGAVPSCWLPLNLKSIWGAHVFTAASSTVGLPSLKVQSHHASSKSQGSFQRQGDMLGTRKECQGDSHLQGKAEHMV